MDMSHPFPVTPAADSKREKDRESMFLLASIVFENSTQKHSMRVRNISNGGMMVDCYFHSENPFSYSSRACWRSDRQRWEPL